MSTPINDGGPAFPESASGPYIDGEIVPGRPGMTLRDWFAGLAMQAIISKNPAKLVPSGINEGDRQAASGAYCYADAMLQAREVKP